MHFPACIAVAAQCCLAATAIEEFTLYTEPISVHPGQVYNRAINPVPLPDTVVKKYAGKQMGIVSFQLDIVRRSEGKEDIRVPLYEVYNHHSIQVMSSKMMTDALHRAWRHADSSGPDPRTWTSHCGLADVARAARAGGYTGSIPDYWFGPVTGAEYRDADRDLSKPYRQIVDSPEAVVAILHWVNVNVLGQTSLFECPCTSDRIINVTNGTIDGAKPLAFNCEADLIKQHNGGCKLDWYIGGYRCCEDGAWVVEEPFRRPHGPVDTVFGKFTFRVDNVERETQGAYFDLLDVTGHNTEYDIPKCNPTVTPQCVHIASHVQNILKQVPQVLVTLPWARVELLTARGHQRVGGLGMELYNDETGELLCASKPRYGHSTAAGDELGFIVGIPPCVWGAPPLPPPPQLSVLSNVRVVSRYNSTDGHLGVTGLWFMQVGIPGHLKDEGSNQTAFETLI